jgi:cystathionine beta-lyase
MKSSTKLTHLGRNPEQHHGVVNPPVYHASTILFPTYADFMAARNGTYAHSSYGRYGTESTRALESALAELEGADYAMVVPSGMAAITTTLLALLSQGDHILVADTVYEPTRRFCTQELARYGVQTTFYDPLAGASIAALIQENTKVVFLESPGSNSFEIQDIPAIAEAAHAKDVLVVADTTYSSPLIIKPFELGVDVALYSASKYISGHSDLMMGVVTATKKVFSKLVRTHHFLGNTPGPDDVYLAQRGLRTLEVRLRQHEEQGRQVAHWLKNRTEVALVLHPTFAECPGHSIWARDAKGPIKSNGLFSIVLKSYSEEAVAAMLEGMKYFRMGFSWGGYESLMIPFDPAPLRTVTSWAHEGPALRIHVGLEAVEDLIADLEAGFARLAAAEKKAA